MHSFFFSSHHCRLDFLNCVTDFSKIGHSNRLRLKICSHLCSGSPTFSGSTWPTLKRFWTRFPEFPSPPSETSRTPNSATSKATLDRSCTARLIRPPAFRAFHCGLVDQFQPWPRCSPNHAVLPGSSHYCAIKRSAWKAPACRTWRPSRALFGSSTWTSTSGWSCATPLTTGKPRRRWTLHISTAPAMASLTSSPSPSTTQASPAASGRDSSSAWSLSAPATCTGTTTAATTSSFRASAPRHSPPRLGGHPGDEGSRSSPRPWLFQPPRSRRLQDSAPFYLSLRLCSTIHGIGTSDPSVCQKNFNRFKLLWKSLKSSFLVFTRCALFLIGVENCHSRDFLLKDFNQLYLNYLPEFLKNQPTFLFCAPVAAQGPVSPLDSSPILFHLVSQNV